MFTERWDEIKDRLLATLDLAPAVRSAYLAQIGSVDPDLQMELSSLIASHEQTGADFLDSRVSDFILTSAGRGDGSSFIGRRVGCYQIVQLIGTGGMGEVYRAFRADDQYCKQVAIKLIRGGQDSDAVVQRFRIERQILASLDHPNIARMLDGGRTEEGLPYFVMELVEGKPIDEYCDEHRLPVRDRLELFTQVCSAVQYAHQRLIIHRDIKPGNILVTAEGVSKLLDFGIAKLLDTAAGSELCQPTLAPFQLLTPGYASPEQIRAQPINITSDVYSLGVVLYELLTGRSPYRLAGRTASELSWAACEEEPENLSSAVHRVLPEAAESSATTPNTIAAVRQSSPKKLSTRFKGDLDNIVGMALRKEPERRYASVEQFAQDLRRCLGSFPVMARRDSFGYRTSRFVKRHRIGVIAAGLVAAALLTATLVTLRANQVAREERARAERRFSDLRKLANSMFFDLHEPIHRLPGSVVVEKMLYENGLKYLDSLASEVQGDPSLQREVAVGYKRLGDSQGSPYGGNLGDYQDALASYRKSLQMRQALVQGDARNLQDRIELANIYRTIGALLYKTGDVSSGSEAVHRALEIARPLAKENQESVDALRELASSLLTVGSVDGESSAGGSFVGHPSIALRYHLEALDVYRVLRTKQAVRLWPLSIAYVDRVISIDYLKVGNTTEAIQYGHDSLTILSQVSESDTALVHLLIDGRASAHSIIGDALLFSGHRAEAVDEYRRERSLFQKIYDPADTASRGSVADALISLGNAQSLTGELSSGLQQIRKGLGTLSSESTTDPIDDDTALLLGRGSVFEGEVLERLGDESKALRSYEKAAAMFESRPLANRPALKSLCAAVYAKVAGALARLGRRDLAQETYAKALALISPQRDSAQPAAQDRYVLVDIYAGLGDLASEHAGPRSLRGEAVAEACSWYQKSMENWRQLPLRSAVSPIGFKVIDANRLATKLVGCH
jgi:serine/threonine protein kinase/tetratricopeptide (TPR) repeat protein